MEEKQIFNTNITANLVNKLNPIKIHDCQASQLKLGTEQPEIPKIKPKNEKNPFGDLDAAKRIEDENTFKMKVQPRSEKFITKPVFLLTFTIKSNQNVKLPKLPKINKSMIFQKYQKRNMRVKILLKILSQMKSKKGKICPKQ